MAAIDGLWKVRRESGLLPPFGLRKFIAGDHGWTMLGFLPVAPFKVEGTQLRYKLWPLRDEVLLRDGHWYGRGYAFGRRYCEFRLEPEEEKVE
ncbi:MAG: hypothetical protein IRZ16_16295 [Myxococcaceae bacterium]|nr:hypothetical protein [Myxococcaceae bacterium]